MTSPLWRLPLWGRRAQEPVPAWLIHAWQAGIVRLNPLGGFTTEDEQSCQAGDSIALLPDNTIRFYPADTTPIEASVAAQRRPF